MQNLHYVDMFDKTLQYEILKILKKIDRLNQQIDIAKAYDMKTFEVEDPSNHRRICANLDISLQNLGRWEESTVRDIIAFIAKYEKIDQVVRFN